MVPCASGQWTELRLVDLPQQMREAWFDENSRGENGTLRELALDDAFPDGAAVAFGFATDGA